MSDIKLTPEQEAKMPDYVKKWVSIGTATEPTDMIAAAHWIKEAYKAAGAPAPTYILGPVAGPYEAQIAEDALKRAAADGVEFDPEHPGRALNDYINAAIREAATAPRRKLSYSNQIYGFQEYWLSYYDFVGTECGDDITRVKPLLELAKVCGWWTPLNDVAIVQNRPLEIHMNAAERLHNPTGAAIRFAETMPGVPSHSNVYAVNGVRVPRAVIENTYNGADIDAEQNAEVRRIMIERYGAERYITETGAELVNKDEFGELYRKHVPDDEAIFMVKVVNSTQEPDGTFKDYWIRVDPNAYGGLKTARAAVASTWRNEDGSLIFARPEDYDCEIET
jgi:hypothetical protein